MDLNIFFNQHKSSLYRKKELILRGEDNLPYIFYIKQGFVRVYGVSEEGEELTLAILSPADFFPVTWTFDHIPSHYYLEAITNTEVVRVHQDQFLQFINTHPKVFHDLAGMVLSQFGQLWNRIEYLTFGNAYTKVASTLLVLAEKFGEKDQQEVVINVPLTHKDIAALVGITRETACLEIKKLERKGVIGHLGRAFVVKNVDKLEEESTFGQPIRAS